MCPYSTDSECVHFREKVYMGDKLTDCMFVLCILKSLYSKLFGFSFFFPKGSIKNVYKYDGIALISSQ